MPSTSKKMNRVVFTIKKLAILNCLKKGSTQERSLMNLELVDPP